MFGLFAFLGAIAGESTPIDPSADLSVHLMSDTDVTGTLEGPVTSVASQAPASVTFTASSPNSPVWKENIFHDGKESIYFPEEELDYLTATSKVICPDGFSCFVVFSTLGNDSSSSNANINPPATFFGDHNTTNSRNQLGLTGGNVVYCYKVGGTTWTKYEGSGDTLNDGNVHTLAVIHTLAGSLSVYVDGVLRISESGVTYDAAQTGIHRIGCGYDSADQAKNLHLAELKVWDGAIAASSVAGLHADAMTYWVGDAPSFSVSSISPTSGTERGGVSVTITGTGFTGATSASVGGLTLNSFTVVNDTTITGVTKMQPPGAKNVVVTNGTTATLTSGYTVNEVGTYTSGVKWRGINRAGPEYGADWDGWTGQSYFEIPTGIVLSSEITKYKDKGFNIIRVPFAWERMQHTLNGALATPYSTNYKTYVEALTNAGFRVVVDCHSYMRYATGTHDGSGNQQGGYVQRVMNDGHLTSAHLVDLWTKVAGLFVNNHYVQFALMNEPHDMASMNSTALFASFNAQIAAIRGTGAKQLIHVSNSEGSEVTHWNVWSPNGGPLDSVAALDVVDSENNFAFEHHCYISDPSATSYSTILATITNWSRTNGKKAILTEGFMHYTAANGAAAWTDLMNFLNANNDVWLGVMPWNLTPHWYLSQDGNYANTVDTAAMPWYAAHLTPNKVT